MKPRSWRLNKNQHGKERLHLRVAKAQGRRPLPVDLDGANHLLKRVFADGAVVGNSLDVQQTPIGLKADLPQRGQIRQRFADAEVPRVVDGGFGAERAPFLVILLDPGIFVIDVQRRNHAVGDNARAKPAGSAAADPAIEDQRHLTGPSDIQVFPDHFLEKDPPGGRSST